MYLFWHVSYLNQKQMWNTWLNSKIFTITFYTQVHLSDSTEIKFIFLFYFSHFNYPVAKGNLFEVDNSWKIDQFVRAAESMSFLSNALYFQITKYYENKQQ